MLTISQNKKNLLKEGQPFFYLADTCWSAFTNITDDEWDYYLYKRRAQVFNTLQINILPQWDASNTDLDYHPFVNGDPYKLNEDYFDHAYKMCVKAKQEGFELALVVLWCNYVPGTWASRLFSGDILPYDMLEGYVKKVHETFTSLNPIYVISGDTDFPTDETIQYYTHVADLLRPLAHECLMTTHIKGRYSEIPEGLYKHLDFLMYQSGHNAKDFSMPYSLSETMQEKYPGKPLINSEPCYEGMGYSGGLYGRWTRRDVRRAAYVSVLSGASAGITYGAAGIYSWHKVGKGFNAKLGEGFDMPKSFEEALGYKGAWDYGYLKKILEELHITDITPCNAILLNKTTEIRIAKTNHDSILIYVPHNTTIKLNGDYSAYRAEVIDLAERFVSNVNVTTKDNMTKIAMHPFDEDALIILRK